MAHYRLTVDQVSKLSATDVAAMEFAFLLLERRQSESLGETLGSHLGTTWIASALRDGESPTPDTKRFTWSLRQQPNKLSTPLTTVVASGAGIPFMEQLKKAAEKSDTEANRKDPSILRLPSERGWLEGCEIVDMSKVSPKQFIKFVGQFGTPKSPPPA